MSLTVTLLLWCADARRVQPEEIARRLDGATIQVDDRVASVLGAGEQRQFRLSRAKDVVFRVGDRGPRSIQGNVRVVGVVAVETGDIFVDVRSLTMLPGDDEVYAQRAEGIADGGFLDWYELADWARTRGRLYDDASMNKLAQSAYERGMAVEHQQSAGKLDLLQALRERWQQQDFVVRVDLVDVDHEILVARLATDATADAGKFESMADEVKRVLLEGGESTRAASDADYAVYQRDRVGVFRSSSMEKRRELARRWEVELRQQAMEERVRAGQMDLESAAERSASVFPDDPSIARGWWRRAIEERESRLANLSAREVEALSGRSADQLGDGRRAIEIKRRWLALREEELRANEKLGEERSRQGQGAGFVRDARSRWELAQNHLAWFAKEGERDAGRLLLESAEILPDFEPASEGLRKLGYRRSAEGKWLSPEESARIEEQERAPRTVESGMMEADVERVMGSADGVVVTAGKPGMGEMIWRYSGASRDTYVVFRQSGAASWIVNKVVRPSE